jgi:hypothetical protein
VEETVERLSLFFKQGKIRLVSRRPVGLILFPITQPADLVLHFLGGCFVVTTQRLVISMSEAGRNLGQCQKDFSK